MSLPNEPRYYLENDSADAKRLFVETFPGKYRSNDLITQWDEQTQEHAVISSSQRKTVGYISFNGQAREAK